MSYNVSEVSEITKLSKVSIYSRFKLKKFEPYLTKKQGVVYITEEGLKIIVGDLKENKEPINYLKEEAYDSIKGNKEELSFKTDYINTLKDQLKIKDTQILEKDLQLKEKDLQIHEINNRLSQEQDLHKNTQILFKQQQPQQILQLEAHFEELDNKLIEIKDKMQKKEKDHKGIFKKIFSK